MSLKGKCAIITGAGRGIGKQIAIDLAKEGCNIVAASRTVEQINKTVQELEKLGARAVSFTADLSEPLNISKLVEQTILEFGKIDILINNMAILIPKFFTEETLDDFDRTISANLRSMFIPVQPGDDSIEHILLALASGDSADVHRSISRTARKLLQQR